MSILDNNRSGIPTGDPRVEIAAQVAKAVAQHKERGHLFQRMCALTTEMIRSETDAENIVAQECHTLRSIILWLVDRRHHPLYGDFISRETAGIAVSASVLAQLAEDLQVATGNARKP